MFGSQITEGIVIACLVMLISGYFGPQVWKSPVADIVGFRQILGEFNMQTLFCIAIISAFFVAHLPNCVHNVYVSRKRKNLSFTTTLLEWGQIIAFSASSAAWLLSDNTNILKDNHLVLFALTTSFVFSRMTTKIILVKTIGYSILIYRHISHMDHSLTLQS